MDDTSREFPWSTLSRQVVYDNPWIQVSDNQVLNPSGNPCQYGVVHFKNLAIGVIPLDADCNTWLVGQSRYALGEYSWEIPMGGGPKDEAPWQAAYRELLEETGLKASLLTRVMTLHTSNSVTDESGYVYLATGLTQARQQLEDSEDIELRKLPLDEALEWVMDGRITDAISAAGLLKVAFLRQRGELPGGCG